MSTLRSGGDDAARRSYLGVSRATLVEADDKPKMQEVTIRARFGEQFTNVEYWQSHGFTHVPLKPDDQEQKQAEVLIAYLGGSPDHPIAISIADRRYRLTELKEGDVAAFDHRGQKTIWHKDGVTHTSPMTITHNVVDKDGKVLSTIVQHKDGKKITMQTADKAMVELDGPNITKTPGPGGKIKLNGAVDVSGALTAASSIAAAGIPAAHVGGDTPAAERDAAIAALEAGRLRVLTNVEVFTEGFDLPAIDAVILLRPTRSLALHRQMVGRGLRAAPGKGPTVILDHAGLFYDHGLPDEPVEWALDRSGRRRGALGAERLRRCPECSAVHAMAASCPECGHAYTAADRTIQMVFGDLREVSPSEGYERIADFARRVGKDQGGVRWLFNRGLPRADNGFIPIEEALSWLKSNSHSPRRASKGNLYTLSSFGKEIGVSLTAVKKLTIRGLPVTDDGFVPLDRGLEWVAANSLARSYKKHPPDLPEGSCETRQQFARRLGKTMPQITTLIRRGMPRASNGWICVEPALAWIDANQPNEKLGLTVSKFAKRLGVKSGQVYHAIKRGLPREMDGSISVVAGIEWWRMRRRPNGER